MEPQAWLELSKSLGIAGPFIAILVYLLRQSNIERREINQSQTTMLKEIISVHSKANMDLALALNTLAEAVKATSGISSIEHESIRQEAAASAAAAAAASAAANKERERDAK